MDVQPAPDSLPLIRGKRHFPLYDFTAIAAIIQHYFAGPWPRGARAPGREIASLYKEFLSVASFGLDPYLEKTYYLRERKFFEITSMGEGHGIFPNRTGSF
jgi:hypothetical protein